MERRSGFVVGYRSWGWEVSTTDPGLDANGVGKGTRWAQWRPGQTMVARCMDRELCHQAVVDRRVMAQVVALDGDADDRLRPGQSVRVSAVALTVGQADTRDLVLPGGFLGPERAVRRELAEMTAGWFSEAGALPPTRHCRCGIHAWTTLEESFGYSADLSHPSKHRCVIHGAIAAWGTVVPHPPEGFRAQYARVVAFVRPKTTLVPAAEWLAERWGVPLLSRRYLEAHAREHGEECVRRPEPVDAAP